MREEGDAVVFEVFDGVFFVEVRSDRFGKETVKGEEGGHRCVPVPAMGA